MPIIIAVHNNITIAIIIWATTGCWAISAFAVSVKNWIKSDVPWPWCTRIVVGSTRITSRIIVGSTRITSRIVVGTSRIVIRASGIVIRATVVAVPGPGQSRSLIRWRRTSGIVLGSAYLSALVISIGKLATITVSSSATDICLIWVVSTIWAIQLCPRNTKE